LPPLLLPRGRPPSSRPSRLRAPQPSSQPHARRLQPATQQHKRPSAACLRAPPPAVSNKWDPPVISYLKPWPSRTPAPPPSPPRVRFPRRGPHAKRCSRPLFKPPPPP
jgi:hypothetical protein